MTVTELLAGIYEPDQHGHRVPESLYGAAKVWAYLQRQGFPVARYTIERLMREHGWRGVTRARKVRTTVAAPAAARAPDLVNRCFTAEAPDVLWVADFTYVAMVQGFGYTAFVIDAFAGYIPGWECSVVKSTTFVESALRQAALRARQGHPLVGGTVFHSDAGSGARPTGASATGRAGGRPGRRAGVVEADLALPRPRLPGPDLERTLADRCATAVADRPGQALGHTTSRRPRPERGRGGPLGRGGLVVVMRAVIEVGQPLIDDPARLAPVTGLGVDEHAWQRANRYRHTAYATGVVGFRTGAPAGCWRSCKATEGKVYAD